MSKIFVPNNVTGEKRMELEDGDPLRNDQTPKRKERNGSPIGGNRSET